MRQIIRYVVVGGLSNLVGYFVYLLLTWFGMEPKLAMSIVYVTAAMIGFFGNRKWTFSHVGKGMPAFVRYVLVHSCGYGINFLILYVFSDMLLFPHEIVQAVAIFVVAVFLFVSFRKFVFASVRNESIGF